MQDIKLPQIKYKLNLDSSTHL